MAIKSVNRLRWSAPTLPWEEARANSAIALEAAERLETLWEAEIGRRIATREAAEKTAALNADAEADEAEAEALRARQRAERRIHDQRVVVLAQMRQLKIAKRRLARLEAEVSKLRSYPRNAR